MLLLTYSLRNPHNSHRQWGQDGLWEAQELGPETTGGLGPPLLLKTKFKGKDTNNKLQGGLQGRELSPREEREKSSRKTRLGTSCNPGRFYRKNSKEV